MDKRQENPRKVAHEARRTATWAGVVLLRVIRRQVPDAVLGLAVGVLVAMEEVIVREVEERRR